MKALTRIICLLIFVFILPAQAYEVNEDVLFNDAGKWYRAWVVKVLDNDSYLIALNWRAQRMHKVTQQQLQKNTRAPMPSEKKQVTGWTHEQTGLWHLSSSVQSSYFIAASGAGDLQIFERDTFFPLVSLPKQKALNDIAMHPSGDLFASCQQDGQVHLFALPEGQVLERLNFASACHLLAFSQKQLIVVGTPKSQTQVQGLWVYDLEQKKLEGPQQLQKMTQRYISALRMNPNNTHLALALSNRAHGIEIYRLNGLHLKAELKLPSTQDVLALDFSPEGRYLAVGNFAGQIDLWKWETQQRFWSQAWRPQNKKAYPKALHFSPDGQTIAACGQGQGKAIKLYRLGNGKVTQELGEDSSLSCLDLIFQSDGQALYKSRQIYSNFGEVVVERLLKP